MAYFHDKSRIRGPLRITIDPEVRAMADELAAEAHVTLSRLIEQLIRDENARIRRRAKKETP